MKFHSLLLSITIVLLISCGSGPESNDGAAPSHEVTFMENEADKSIEVLVDGQPFTSLRWSDNLTKPVLFPIRTSQGTEITRGFPIDPKVGERADHPHQIGNWLTYGNVEGSDFWGNGSKGLGSRNANGGTIQLESVLEKTEGQGEASFSTKASWIDSTGKTLLSEETTYHFRADDSVRMIDRIVTLTAESQDVSLPDTKEGMFGIRVARELELPSQGEVTLYSASGEPERVREMNNEAISGDYLSSTEKQGSAYGEAGPGG